MSSSSWENTCLSKPVFFFYICRVDRRYINKTYIKIPLIRKKAPFSLIHIISELDLSTKVIPDNIFLFIKTSVDTEMCCPKGKCGCQYFILLTEKKNHGHSPGPGFF